MPCSKPSQPAASTASTAPPTTTIRKAVITSFGADPDANIDIVRESLPAPTKSNVQVSVLYAGFSGSDITMARGVYPFQPAAPLVPGYTLVGRVSARGPDVRLGFKEGDLVAAMVKWGADADRVDVDERWLVPVPEGLDVKIVPALVLDWSTALGMVEQHAKVQKGHRVFVHGLSGAVGYATMVLCLRAGATVYGTASPRNHEALRRLGAEEVFTYENRDWVKAIQELGGVDAVFDPLGFESWDHSYSALRNDGGKHATLVGYGGNLGTVVEKDKPAARSLTPWVVKLLAQNLKVWSNRATVMYGVARNGKTYVRDLERLMELAGRGEIVVPVKGVWDLEDVREAHRAWGRVEGIGSMVIRVGAEE